MTKLVTKAIVIGQALLLVTFAAAWAGPQQDAQQAYQQDVARSVKPGAVEQSLEPPMGSAFTDMPDILVRDRATGGLMGGDEVEFVLKDIRFSGNETFDSRELYDLLGEYAGRTVQVSALTEMADRITRYYHQEGLILSRAFVPPQTIDGGVVTIQILEGRLGQVKVLGNERYKEKIIKGVMNHVKNRGAVSTDSLERALLLLMDYPGLRVRATLAAGETPGTTDIIVECTEAKIWQAGLEYDNFGSEYVAANRIGATLNFANPTGYGDSLGFRFNLGPDMGDDDGHLQYARADWVVPVNTRGTRVGLAGSRVRYEVGEELAVLDIAAESDLVSGWVSHPFIRSRNLSLWCEAGLDINRIRYDMFDITLYEEDLHVGRLGTHLEWLDRWDGRTVVAANLYKGFSDEEIKSRLYADSTFLKVTGDIRRFQDLPGEFTGIFALSGQFTTDRLPASEEFVLGGAGTIRGYAQGDYSGDHGVYYSAEIRYPLWTQGSLDWQKESGLSGNWTIQLAGFADFGRVWVKDNMPAELSDANMGGLGLGLRVAYAPYLQAKLDWAKAVMGDKPLDPGTEEDGAWYLQIAVSY
ncbi:MAG: ShlB/FhaC/HecB family hemolysin secretion/activation protein [Pseudomonadota bacterium]